MAGTNNFLPIGTAGGANVEGQVAYAADPVVPIGFGLNAVPPSALWNKMMRQSSVITSQFAQMLADYSNLNFLDDGNLATLLTNMKTQFRIRLLANTTFYVRSDGNDANNGLANNAGGAFLTIQRAADVLSNFYDFNSFQVSIIIGTNATYAGATFYFCVGQRSPILVTGFSTAGTIINTPMSLSLGTSVTFSTMKFAGGLNGIVSAGAAVVGAGCEFGTLIGSNTAHLYANGGGFISVSVPYTISGPASTHFQSFGGVIGIGGGGAMAITITGTPNFSNSFASFNLLGLVAFNFTGGAVTFAGAATGTRYSGGNLSCLDSSGSGASYLPGNAAGVLVGGAVYN